jgi:hypothetical protein
MIGEDDISPIRCRPSWYHLPRASAAARGTRRMDGWMDRWWHVEREMAILKHVSRRERWVDVVTYWWSTYMHILKPASEILAVRRRGRVRSTPYCTVYTSTCIAPVQVLDSTGWWRIGKTKKVLPFTPDAISFFSHWRMIFDLRDEVLYNMFGAVLFTARSTEYRKMDSPWSRYSLNEIRRNDTVHTVRNIVAYVRYTYSVQYWEKNKQTTPPSIGQRRL